MAITSPPTTLVVDDRPTNRKVLAAVLEYAGHRVLEASDGAAALEIARAERPDLVITDILMPTMNGYELAQQMRSDPFLARTPIIFYTATYRDREASALARACGAFCVISKPSRPRVILDAVKAALEGREGHISPMPGPRSFAQTREDAGLMPPFEDQFVDSREDEPQTRLGKAIRSLSAFAMKKQSLHGTREGAPEDLSNLQNVALRMSALSELGLNLALERDPLRLLETFCRAARTILPCRLVGVLTLEGDERTPHSFVTDGTDAGQVLSLGALDLERDPLRQVIDEQRTVSLKDLDSDSVKTGFAQEHPGLRSFVAVPLATQTQNHGLVYFADRAEVKEFTLEDEQLASVLAGLLAVNHESLHLYGLVQGHSARLQLEITERARVEAQLARRASLAALMGDVGLALSESHALPEVLDRCAKAMVQHLDAAFARVWTLNEKENVLELKASAGMYTHLDGPHGRVPVGKFKIGLIALEKCPHLTNSVVGDSRVGDQEWARREGMVAFAGYPLIVEDRLLGVMAMFARHTLDDFTLQALSTVANEIARDLKRKRAEDQLRESEARFRQLVESMGEVFWMSSADNQEFFYVSPAYDTVWGRAGSDLYSNPSAWSDAIHPDDRAQTLVEMEECLREGRSFSLEYRIVRPDGAIRWIHARGRPVRDAGGVSRIVGIAEDISERRDLGEQLRQAQKMEAVGMLAGGVAHDFNNLLTAISGYSGLALMRLREDDPLRRDLQEISTASDRASRLTRQLLMFSRKQVLQPKVLDVNAVITELEKMLRRLIGEDVAFMVALGADLGMVKADAGQIEQVIVNLVVNARDAMPSGGRLTIETANIVLEGEYARTHVEARAGSYVFFAVSDTGCGMDAATRARIFEPFFTTKGPGKGTGLGLSTAYGVVKQSGGFISCYSEPGVGTSFKVYLPQAMEGTYERIARPSAEVLQGSETILLVEDEDIVRRVALLILTMQGYAVLEARDGNEALAICDRHKGTIDLVITDVVMPGMSGPELAERIGERRPKTPVLYTSGYTDDAIVHHGVLASEMAFIQKPYRPSALLEKVREVLTTRLREPAPAHASS